MPCYKILSCTLVHFADDTNVFHINKSLKILNKLINNDLKNLPNWLNASKMLNVKKTELVIFKLKHKKLDFECKIKLNGKKFFQRNSVTDFEYKN